MTSIVSLGVPKAISSFNNSLEGITELSGSSSTTYGYNLLQLEDIDESQPRKETHGVEFRKFQTWIFLLSSSHGVMDSVTFLTTMCDNVPEVLLTKEGHLRLGVQSFPWVSRVHWVCGWSLVNSPSIHMVNSTWAKAPIINHSVSLSSSSGLQVNKDTFIRQGIRKA